MSAILQNVREAQDVSSHMSTVVPRHYHCLFIPHVVMECPLHAGAPGAGDQSITQSLPSWCETDTDRVGHGWALRAPRGGLARE